MTKQLVTIEFRYLDAPKARWDSEHKTKTITVGIYDTLEEAVCAGNALIERVLSKHFEVRPDDKFAVKGLFGFPDRLVSNTCYPTKRVAYFASITTLTFGSVSEAIVETFEAYDRYRKSKENEDDY